jgi:hypothetical protein
MRGSASVPLNTSMLLPSQRFSGTGQMRTHGSAPTHQQRTKQ